MEEEKLQPRLDVISQIRQVRKEQKMTQEALAQRAGTKKSNISRLESGKYNPSLDLLIRVAACLGKRIHIWME
ncbi:MAG: helix-turn-helix transcriptional regulator [Eubacterium sp.]|nr:helix-turn-helix transcriptional regulator [Eubacterium sp.]